MKRVLVLGGDGMLGYMVVKYVRTLPDYQVSYTSRNAENEEAIILDVSDGEWLEKIINKMKPDLVVNCIGIVNNLIEDYDKDDVVHINSYFPHRLAAICIENDSKLIHISTDCVFSGVDGGYTEDSEVSPTDFYGLSKATGEVNDDHNLTMRTSIIGPELYEPTNGLLEWFLKQENKEVSGYTKGIWSGVTTLELAKKIIEMYEQEVTGLINIASQPISKYDLLELINKVYDVDVEIRMDKFKECDRSMRSIRDDVSYVVPLHERMLQELKDFTGEESK